MIDAASKAFFHLLARSRSLQTPRVALRHGAPDSFARRFIAGETIDEAIAAARTLEARGLTQTLDYLGESVGTLRGSRGRHARVPGRSSTRSSPRASAATSR